jgi:HSP20 family protein
LNSMRDAMDRLFDEGFSRPHNSALWDVASVPAKDCYQTGDALTVKMSLPGVKPEDIQISVANGVLTIRGEAKEEKEEKEKNDHLRERRFGTFSRSASLPSHVSVEKSEVEFAIGVLIPTLPKAEEARAKTITVKTEK